LRMKNGQFYWDGEKGDIFGIVELDVKGTKGFVLKGTDSTENSYYVVAGRQEITPVVSFENHQLSDSVLICF